MGRLALNSSFSSLLSFLSLSLFSRWRSCGGSRRQGERRGEGARFRVIEAKKFLRRGAGNDAARLEQDDARGEEQGFAQIVRDEDDGLAKAAGQGAEFALEFGAGDGIERAEGLVHQKNRRIGGEGASDADALALAAGKFAGTAMGKFAGIEADEVKHFLDTRGNTRGIPLSQSGNQGDIFCDREVREKTCVLYDVTDAAAEADEIPIASGALLDKNLSLRGK
jgi:hypothetical protein